MSNIERELAAQREQNKTALRLLDADLDELWDKVKHALGRVSKRAAAAQLPDAHNGDQAGDATPPLARFPVRSIRQF